MKLKLVLAIVSAIIVRFYFKELSVTNLFSKLVNLYNVQNDNIENTNIFSKEQLKQYNGIINKQLYISILGNVYDVTKAGKHYGPGQSYHIFTGKDASKSFITGDFNEDTASDDISDLKPEDLLSLIQWKNFYDKEYIKKGVLIGKYFDEQGIPTKYSEHMKKLISDAEKNKDDKQNDEKLYPPCNIEWNANSGTRVWCTKQSGGINRNWIGVPRKYFKAGSNKFRCSCAQNTNDPKLKEYDNCDATSTSCYIENETN